MIIGIDQLIFWFWKSDFKRPFPYYFLFSYWIYFHLNNPILGLTGLEENLWFFFKPVFGGIGGEAPDQGHSLALLNEVK